MTDRTHRMSDERSTLGIAIAVVCCAGFVVGVWVPVADSLDMIYPSRHVISERAPTPNPWQLQTVDGASASPAVHDALGGVASGFVKLVQEFGGQLILTRTESLSHIRNIDEHDIMDAAGVYYPAERTAYIGVNSEQAGATALHELGHMLDHALGGLSSQQKFMSIYEGLRSDPRLGTYPRKNQVECFAELFSRYYFSDRRRQHLEDRFPAAADYFSGLERRAMTCPHLSCFNP